MSMGRPTLDESRPVFDFTTERFINLSVSRHSPFFSLVWFRRNPDTCIRRMTFGTEVLELLDNSKYRITRKEDGDRLAFRFWPLDGKGRFACPSAPAREIVVSRGGNVLNVRKRTCPDNCYVYAVAVKLGFLEFPRKWRTLMRLPGENVTASWRIHMEKETQVIEVVDRFYNKVKIPISDVIKIVKFGQIFKKYNRSRKLRQFQNENEKWVAWLRKKIKTAISQREEKPI